MERYTTPELEVIEFDEDVILASGSPDDLRIVGCEYNPDAGWIISRSDGFSYTMAGSEDARPSICP